MKKAEIKKLGTILYEFDNSYGEEFLVYEKENDESYYITGDEFGWVEHKLIFIDYNTFTAIDEGSFGFWFSDDELKHLKKFTREIVHPRLVSKGKTKAN
jgi:hypothetical protein